MSTNPYREYFEGPAKRRIRSIRSGHEAAIGLALIYAAVGASLGILAGTTVAIRVFPTGGTVTASDLAQSSASVAGLNGPLKTITAAIPAIQSKPSPPAAPIPTTQHTLDVIKHMGATVQSAHIRVPKRKPFVLNHISLNGEAPAGSRKSKDPDAEATGAAVVLAEVPASRPVYLIEGDAAVAGYDAMTGRIETREGRSFSIDTSDSGSNSWDEYSGHVHYRCDAGGNCTLTRTGVVVPHARMTT